MQRVAVDGCSAAGTWLFCKEGVDRWRFFTHLARRTSICIKLIGSPYWLLPMLLGEGEMGREKEESRGAGMERTDGTAAQWIVNGGGKDERREKKNKKKVKKKTKKRQKREKKKIKREGFPYSTSPLSTPFP